MVALDLGLDFHLVKLDVTVLDVIGLGIVAVMLVLLTVRAFGNLRDAEAHPPRQVSGGSRTRPYFKTSNSNSITFPRTM